ncbi:DNA repair nuclease Rad13 [Schizosaccharomyces cryophilus OY26]|uniref:DNA repair nuclease Rad13 n=1 Tax=Schizosaccharomyces cryophilus (strain OY26 / ATCC MYA-4695 / CBS 11777 / NBRC 106824 / NRRL Y48691) TaxID=653667 RepID=S9W831_SCHCR|nr:DNA repair nuclease Rad13 [Schizosaccharomyces cryophilus OY26]EPY53870.1 DNA repair nuclease Rad13 [Schizosaccharomyces cryophilus OY26]
MGVSGLWNVLEPVKRPVKLETLNDKRLAVDASIWIYQFLKAVRDKEGNQLKSSHIVGFFRRICKLLFFGIKPVFVFDGGAPALKRQTLRKRQARRVDRQENAALTANKLYALQMRHQAIRLEEESRKAEAEVDASSQAKHQKLSSMSLDNHDVKPALNQPKRYLKPDPYQLPDMDVSFDNLNSTHDPRVMSQEDLANYASNFGNLEDINLFDFSSIDFDSSMFRSLPDTDKYSILSAARLRSRLRMGLSTEQLAEMFPNRMDFSRFQIERLKERNDLTQRLMDFTGMNQFGPGRVASEKNREYILVKNEGAEGGWALGVISGTAKNDPIVVDEDAIKLSSTMGEDDEDAEFNDVPLPETQKLMNPKELVAAKLKEVKEHSFDEESENKEIDEIMTQLATQESIEAYNRDGTTNLFNLSTADIDNIQQEAESNEDKTHPPKSNDVSSVEKNRSENAVLKLSHVDNVESSVQKDEPNNTIFMDDLPTLDQHESNSALALEPLPFKEMDWGKSIFFSGLKDKAPEQNEFKSLNASNSMLASYKHESENDTGQQQETEEQLDESQMIPQVDRPEGSFDIFNGKAAHIKEESQPLDSDRFSLLGNEDINRPSSSHVQVGEEDFPYKNVKDFPKESSNVNSKQVTTPEVSMIETVNKADEEDNIFKLGKENYSYENADFRNESSNVGSQKETIPEVPAIVKASSADEEDNVEVAQNLMDEEEEDMMIRMAEEEKEYDRFVSELNKKTTNNSWDQEAFEKRIQELKVQRRTEKRDADEVTQIMIRECQELLQLFGLPYIVAPQEAEAQCAKLLELKLVDGIVTDDSDVFLFGGTRIYRNMFNQNKYVELYLMDDMKREFNVDQVKLIRLAHLLGSDYTMGLAKVGPVLALEILHEFPGDAGLFEFKQWFQRLSTGQAIKEDLNTPVKRRVSKLLGKVIIPPDFPNPMVDEAYLHPNVDDSKQTFQWGIPDLDELRQFLMATVGWSKQRANEVLLPIIQDLNRKDFEGTQSNLTQFFSGGNVFAPRVAYQFRSKRMENALASFRSEQNEQDSAASLRVTDASANEESERNQMSDGLKRRIAKRKKMMQNRKDSDSDSSSDGETSSLSFSKHSQQTAPTTLKTELSTKLTKKPSKIRKR